MLILGICQAHSWCPISVLKSLRVRLGQWACALGRPAGQWLGFLVDSALSPLE